LPGTAPSPLLAERTDSFVEEAEVASKASLPAIPSTFSFRDRSLELIS